MKRETLEIGSSVPRADAAAKVTGAEKYAADHFEAGKIGMLWAGARRAGIPHGRIQSIDVAAAQALPGVFAVLTHKDVPGSNRHGIVHQDQPILADTKVRHCGDAVALVLAEHRDTLRQALELIQVDIEPLPGVFSAEQAMEAGAPIVHEDHPDGNVVLHGMIEVGTGSAALAECAVMAEGTFEVPHQAHAFLETENGWARLEPDGQLLLVASTQSPFRDRFEVGRALGMDPLRIRVIAPYLGGGFGGKDGATVQCLLALGALHAQGRPVKMCWEREENFLAGTKRHPAKMHARLGAGEDGSFHALDFRVTFDTGAYAHLGGEVLALGMEHAGGPYRIPNTHIEGWCVYTNNPVSGAFRGFGVPQVAFALEQLVDMLAARLGRDPLELRRQNAVQRGDTNAVGVTLITSTGMVQCLDTARRHPLWTGREVWKRGAGPFKRRGVGVAAVMHGSGYGPGIPDYANAKVELLPSGKIALYAGVADMGQGNAGTNLQIAGELLNQDRSALELILPDTERALPSCSSSASRTTYTYGNALIKACEDLKHKILNRARILMFLERGDELELLPGRVRHLISGRELPLASVAGFLDAAERVSTHCHISPIAKEQPPSGKELRFHGFPHVIISYAAHLVRIEVDELTGAVEVKDYLAITDSGRVLNPQIYEQQVQGAIAQGLGYALCEEFQVLEGRSATQDFATYIIPTAVDVPEMTSVSVETLEHTGPFGMKGVGEIGINAPLPAVANALADACGVRIFRGPLTGERVLMALVGRRGGRE
jgi:CO/xanthine dehydrogenase Mo-binding subunit